MCIYIIHLRCSWSRAETSTNCAESDLAGEMRLISALRNFRALKTQPRKDMSLENDLAIRIRNCVLLHSSDSMSLMPQLLCWNWEKQLCLAETDQCFFHPMQIWYRVNSVFWPWTCLLLLRWQHRCRECETSPRCLEWRLPSSRGECLKVWRLQICVDCIFLHVHIKLDSYTYTYLKFLNIIYVRVPCFKKSVFKRVELQGNGNCCVSLVKNGRPTPSTQLTFRITGRFHSPQWCFVFLLSFSSAKGLIQRSYSMLFVLGCVVAIKCGFWGCTTEHSG